MTSHLNTNFLNNSYSLHHKCDMTFSAEEDKNSETFEILLFLFQYPTGSHTQEYLQICFFHFASVEHKLQKSQYGLYLTYLTIY